MIDSIISHTNTILYSGNICKYTICKVYYIFFIKYCRSLFSANVYLNLLLYTILFNNIISSNVRRYVCSYEISFTTWYVYFHRTLSCFTCQNAQPLLLISNCDGKRGKMSWDVNKRASKLLQVPLQGLTSNI